MSSSLANDISSYWVAWTALSQTPSTPWDPSDGDQNAIAKRVEVLQALILAARPTSHEDLYKKSVFVCQLARSCPGLPESADILIDVLQHDVELFMERATGPN